MNFLSEQTKKIYIVKFVVSVVIISPLFKICNRLKKIKNFISFNNSSSVMLCVFLSNSPIYIFSYTFVASHTFLQFCSFSFYIFFFVMEKEILSMSNFMNFQGEKYEKITNLFARARTFFHVTCFVYKKKYIFFFNISIRFLILFSHEEILVAEWRLNKN